MSLSQIFDTSQNCTLISVVQSKRRASLAAVYYLQLFQLACNLFLPGAPCKSDVPMTLTCQTSMLSSDNDTWLVLIRVEVTLQTIISIANRQSNNPSQQLCLVETVMSQ